MSRMNNEEGLGMADEEIIAELHKKIGVYKYRQLSLGKKLFFQNYRSEEEYE